MSEVYITVNAVDFKTKKPINSNRIWQLKKMLYIICCYN